MKGCNLAHRNVAPIQEAFEWLLKIDMASSSGKVLVYGGKGALGSSVVKYFKGRNWVRILCFGPHRKTRIRKLVLALLWIILGPTQLYATGCCDLE